MAWTSARCGLGPAPYGLGKRPIRQPGSGHGKRTASKLGTRPVTLRRISQHPPVTSKLGLSSRLALPAHFHRQPGFLMCGLLRQDPPPLEAILVIFGRRALIFFGLKALEKKMKNDTTFVRMRSGDHLGDAKCRKRAPHSVEFNFFIICDRHKRFSQNERRRIDLQNVASDFSIFA